MTLAQRWATRRNFLKFRIGGARAAAGVMRGYDRDLLTKAEIGHLECALKHLDALWHNWSNNNKATKDAYLSSWERK